MSGVDNGPGGQREAVAAQEAEKQIHVDLFIDQYGLPPSFDRAKAGLLSKFKERILAEGEDPDQDPDFQLYLDVAKKEDIFLRAIAERAQSASPQVKERINNVIHNLNLVYSGLHGNFQMDQQLARDEVEYIVLATDPNSQLGRDHYKDWSMSEKREFFRILYNEVPEE